MKYVLLFGNTAEGHQAWVNMPEDARKQAYAQIGQWHTENGGKIRGGHELQSPSAATTVRFGEDGQPMVTDGPFIAANEVTGPGPAMVRRRPVKLS